MNKHIPVIYQKYKLLCEIYINKRQNVKINSIIRYIDKDYFYATISFSTYLQNIGG